MALRIEPIRAALREPSFRAYLAANSVSLIGTWMQRIAVGWLAWELTESPFWLGAIAFADLAPAVLIAPYGGVLADRHDRRRILLWTQGAMAVVAFGMALLLWLELVGIIGLTLLVALHGSLIGINQPARLALVPALVGRQHLQTAIALNSVVFNSARFVGPAVAGLVIAWSGVPAALLVNALTYVPILFVLPRLVLNESVRPGAWQGAARAFLEGIAHIRGSAMLAPLFAFFIALSLTVRPLGELLPGFAGGVFDRGVEGLAVLSAAMGLGAVVGGIWVALRADAFDLRRTLLLLLAVTAFATLFALSPGFVLAVPLIAGFGFTLTASGVAMHTAVQLGVEPELRGRVMSLFGLVFRSVPALGALAVGTTAELLGLRAAMLLAAVVFVLAYVWLWRRLPPIDR